MTQLETLAENMTSNDTMDMGTLQGATPQSRTLCLLTESATEARAMNARWSRLDLDDGVSWLIADGAEVALSRRSRGGSLALEPLRLGWKLRLAVANPHGLALRVNGEKLGPAAILMPGDQLEWGDALLHVSIYQRPYIGPAAGEDVGRACPICGLALDEQVTIYRCAACGTCMHWGDGTPDALECARLAGSCVACEGPIVTSPGLVYEPE
jgi:hypothetical protein